MSAIQATLGSRRLRGLRLGLAALLTAALVVGGFGALRAMAKPSKPETYRPSGSADTIRVQWKDTATGVLGFKVRYSRSSSMSGSVTTGCLPPRANPGAYTSYQWIQNLRASTTYYFQVASFKDAQCKTASSGWSTRSDGRKTSAYSYGKPGTPVVNNRASNSVELSFVNVSGAGGYRIRYYSKSGGGKYVWSQVEDVTLGDLSRNTEYWIKTAVAERISLKGEPTDCDVHSSIDCWPSYQQGPYSTEIKVKTSAYTLAPPNSVTISDQDAYQVKVNWREGAPLPAGHQYRVQYSKSKTMSGALYKLAGTGTSTTLTKLSSNTNYYVRVYVVRVTETGSLVTASDKSGYQIAKTRTPFGTFAGRVIGPPPQQVVAMIYAGNELVTQADVMPDGTYTAEVRPGTYKVKLAYIGGDDYASGWVHPTHSPRGGGLISSWGAPFTVNRGQTLQLPVTTLLKGAGLNITLCTTSSPCDSTTNGKITNADVAVIHAHTTLREVDSVQRTNSSGTTRVRGLAQPAHLDLPSEGPGKYWLRIVASGKKTTSVWVEVRRDDPANPASPTRVVRWGYSGGPAHDFGSGTGLEIRMANA